MANIFNEDFISAFRQRYASVDRSHYFLLEEIYSRLFENLKGNFDLCLNLGAFRGEILQFLGSDNFKIEKIIHCDSSYNMLSQIPGLKVLSDQEFLPFKESIFDLVVSGMYLHHVNNLSGMLASIYRTLKTKGIFLANLFGPKTLWELKKSIINAEKSSFTERAYPFIDIKDAGRLLKSAGFKFVTSCSEVVTVNYKNVEQFFTDLKYTAQANALNKKHYGFTTKKEIQKIIQEYERLCEHKITATFEIIILTGVKI